MSQINDIREAYAETGKVAPVARKFQVDEKTVRKYIRKEDFSPKLPIPGERESRLDPIRKIEWIWPQTKTSGTNNTRLYPRPRLKGSIRNLICRTRPFSAMKEYDKDTESKTFQGGLHPVSASRFRRVRFYERGVLIRRNT